MRTSRNNCFSEATKLEMETFYFSCKDFSEYSCKTIRNLFEEKHFADVTILTEDCVEMKLHKIILATGSAFFREILTKITQSNPLLYLKGIKEKELRSIVEFIYSGQTEVNKGDLDNFMEAAGLLKIEGLCDTLLHLDEVKSENNMQNRRKKRVQFSLEQNQNFVFESLEDDVNDNEYEPHEIQSNETIEEKAFAGECSELASSPAGPPGVYKESHVEVKYPCDTCNQTYTRQDNLQRHLKLAHDQLLL